MSRQSRLEDYAKPKNEGLSRSAEQMKAWREYASENSYHSPAPSHSKSDGHGRNHVGGTFMPNVQRRES